MSSMKWIKIATDIFDDEKILLIESMPDGDAIIVIWFKLLALAGKQNNSGVFTLNGKIAYTDEMLATILRKPVNTVRLALECFENFGMIDRVDGVVTVPNWEKHQSLDAYEKHKERDREYRRKKREEQKLIAMESNVDGHVDGYPSTHQADVAPLEEEIDIDIKEKDPKGSQKKDDERLPSPPIPYKEIMETYNTTCTSYPKLTVLSDKRKQAIAARFRTGYKLDDFVKLFQKAEASDFMKGKNNRNWSATFDWMITDSNMAKILDGNYDNKSGTKTVTPKPNRFHNFEERGYDFGSLEARLLKAQKGVM